MHKTITTRHVKAWGKDFTYILSLAGEKTKGGRYSSHIQAAFEAELCKWYLRHKYGIKWYTVRANISDETLGEYANEQGFNLTLTEVFQRLPRDLRDKFTFEGNQIAAAFAELELPQKHKQLVQEAVREERQGLKLARIALKDKLSKERAAVWLRAQQEAAEAWKQAKIELEGLRKEKLTITQLPVTL